MKKSLALMFALSGLTLAGGRAHAAALLGTTIAPIKVVRPAGCAASLDEKKVIPWSTGNQNGAGLNFNAGVDASIGMFADCTRLSAEGSLALNTKLYGGSLTIKPLELTISANSNSDHTNTIAYKVQAFGFTIKDKPLLSSPTAISGAEDVGYTLPNGTLDGSFTYSPDWAGGATATFSYDSVAQVAAAVIYAVGPTEVTVRTIAAGNASARVAMHFKYKGVTYDKSATLDIFRLIQGGRAQLTQVSGSTWKADAANMLSLSDVLGISLTIDIPLAGKKNLFTMVPKEFSNDYAFTKTFTKTF